MAFSSREDLPEGNCRADLIILPQSHVSALALYLDPETDSAISKNWRFLAEKLGLSCEEIKYIGGTKSSETYTSRIFRVWIEREGDRATLNVFLRKLRQLDRTDFSSVIDNAIAEFRHKQRPDGPVPSEHRDEGPSEYRQSSGKEPVELPDDDLLADDDEGEGEEVAQIAEPEPPIVRPPQGNSSAPHTSPVSPGPHPPWQQLQQSFNPFTFPPPVFPPYPSNPGPHGVIPPHCGNYPVYIPYQFPPNSFPVQWIPWPVDPNGCAAQASAPRAPAAAVSPPSHMDWNDQQGGLAGGERNDSISSTCTSESGDGYYSDKEEEEGEEDEEQEEEEDEREKEEDSREEADEREEEGGLGDCGVESNHPIDPTSLVPRCSSTSSNESDVRNVPAREELYPKSGKKQRKISWKKIKRQFFGKRNTDENAKVDSTLTNASVPSQGNETAESGYDSPTRTSSRAAENPQQGKTSVFIMCTDDKKQVAASMKRWLIKREFDCFTVYCDGERVDKLRETLQRLKSSHFVCMLCNEALKKIFDECPEMESQNKSMSDGLTYLSSNVVYRELISQMKNQNGKFIPIVVDEKDWSIIPAALSTFYWYRWPLDKETTRKLLCHLRNEPEFKAPPVNTKPIPIRSKTASPRK